MAHYQRCVCSSGDWEYTCIVIGRQKCVIILQYSCIIYTTLSPIIHVYTQYTSVEFQSTCSWCFSCHTPIDTSGATMYMYMYM